MKLGDTGAIGAKCSAPSVLWIGSYRPFRCGQRREFDAITGDNQVVGLDFRSVGRCSHVRIDSEEAN